MHNAHRINAAAANTSCMPAPPALAGRRPPRRRRSGFTFIEVVVALVIVSVSFLTLLKLHTISIRLIQTARLTTQATLLADEKMAELLAADFPQPQTSSGTVEDGATAFEWRTEVAELRLPLFEQAHISSIRKVAVTVGYKQGSAKRYLEMTTFVTDRKAQ